MRRKQKIAKVGSGTQQMKHATKEVKCSTCNNQMTVERESVSGICWQCVQRMVGIDPKKLIQPHKVKKSQDGFPRGWKLYKQFVHPDGKVFEYGKENIKLNGKLQPTKVVVNTLTRGQRRRLREEKQFRKEQRLAKLYKQKQKDKGRLQ